MSVIYSGDDESVAIVLAPDFDGNLLEMLQERQIWMVDTAQNKAKIDFVWGLYKSRDLYELNREPVKDAYDREETLFDILRGLDNHEYVVWRRIVVHGLSPSPSLSKANGDGGVLYRK